METPARKADEVTVETDTNLSPDELSDNDLSFDAKRLLVQLVKGPYVAQQRAPNLWSALVANEKLIRVSLNNMFLELVIDHDQGLAFARNQRSSQDLPKMMRSLPLTLIDTALVLFLRQCLLRNEGRVFVGRDEIDDQLSIYGQVSQTDVVLFRKRMNSSVKKMTDINVLQPTDEDGRFEISPILRMVFDADEVKAVAAELHNLLESGETTVEDGIEDEE